MRYSQKKCGILYINKVSIGSLTVSGSSIDRISFLHCLLLDEVQSVRQVASRFIKRGYQYPKFIFLLIRQIFHGRTSTIDGKKRVRNPKARKNRLSSSISLFAVDTLQKCLPRYSVSFSDSDQKSIDDSRHSDDGVVEHERTRCHGYSLRRVLHPHLNNNGASLRPPQPEQNTEHSG